MYRLQLDLVQLPGSQRSLPAALCYIFVKDSGKSKQVKNIFYLWLQIHREGLLSVFKMLFFCRFADRNAFLAMALLWYVPVKL